MQYIPFLLLVSTLFFSAKLSAQNYYEVDLATAFHEEGNLPPNFNYLVHYDSQERDFLIANATNTAIIGNNGLWIMADAPVRFTNQVYTSIEVCYDVFPYEGNKLLSPPFQVPSKGPGKLTKGIDSKILQARVARPLGKFKTSPAPYEVVHDLSPRNIVTEGYQCHKLDFPHPLTLPVGARISTRIIIGPKEVFRLDRMRLYRN